MSRRQPSEPGLYAEAAAARELLDAEGETQRAAVQEDFEITLRARRTAEQQRSTEQLEAAEAKATQLVSAAQAQANWLVSEARAEAERLTTQARTEVDQLHAHRDNVLTDLSGLHDRLRGVIDGVA